MEVDSVTDSFKKRRTQPPAPAPKADGKATEETKDKSLGARVRALEQLIVAHDNQIRELTAFTDITWIMPASSELGKRLTKDMKEWNEARPEKGPHPWGGPRITVFMSLLEHYEEAIEVAQTKEFINKLCKSPEHIGAVIIQFARTKETKKRDDDSEQKVILQIRPQYEARPNLTKFLEFLTTKIREAGGELKSDKAPPGPIARKIQTQVNKNRKKKKDQFEDARSDDEE